MRLTMLLFILGFWGAASQNGFYDLQVKDINGDTLSLASFSNKKIVFTPLSAAKPDTSQLITLEILQKANTGIVFIAVPADDFDGPGESQQLRLFQNQFCPSVMMTSPIQVSKSSGLNQHPLFKWLTDVNRNAHFDKDATKDGQLFMVATGAKLYSVLELNAPIEVIEQMLQSGSDLQ